MRTSLAVAAAMVAILSAPPAFTQDHLLGRDTAQARLAAAGAERRHALDAVDRLLATPEAGRAASSVGVDIAAVRATVPSLGDAELADLSARAAALEADPVAGLDHDIKLLLEIFLIVAIVILVLRAL
jgi:pyruvate/2-oxoglutarate dehydrogenase complex dihydrolipoamide acyltransferase (E2) component